MQAVYFDMDGTIANLYNVEGWESKLRAEDASPYADASPLRVPIWACKASVRQW